MRNQTQPAVRQHLGRGQHRLQSILKVVGISLLAAALVVPLWPARTVAAAPSAAPAPGLSAVLSAAAAPASPAAGSGEARLFAFVNEARQAEGLEPLTWDPALSHVAAAHAQDMITAGYFGHISATDGTPAHRAHAAGIEFSRLGENLAGNSDLADAHRMLMESPTHRANIMGPEFTQVGITVIEGGPYGYMIVEMFTVPAAPAIANATAVVSGNAR
ncbi:MAG: CAP domain-containing protein [Symbiobacteriia bacterium]